MEDGPKRPLLGCFQGFTDAHFIRPSFYEALTSLLSTALTGSGEDSKQQHRLILQRCDSKVTAGQGLRYWIMQNFCQSLTLVRVSSAAHQLC
jgi:hypothetical protein